MAGLSVEQPKAQLDELQSQSERLMEHLRLLKKKQFGVSSEQGKAQLDGQLSLLFNETEVHAAPPGLQKEPPTSGSSPAA